MPCLFQSKGLSLFPSVLWFPFRVPVHPELLLIDGLRRGFTLRHAAVLLAFEESRLSSASDYGTLPENQLATELDILDYENFDKFLNLELISVPITSSLRGLVRTVRSGMGQTAGWTAEAEERGPSIIWAL